LTAKPNTVGNSTKLSSSISIQGASMIQWQNV
jgi:hypothetical protein